MKFKVVVRPDKVDGGYTVRCPALPGCRSQGETRAEALANIREAIEGCLLVLNGRARKTAAGETLVEVEV